MPYLYGASIQGIQSFIFETGLLKEIAGASDLIEDLCSKDGSIKKLIGNSSTSIDWLLNAAGNIRFLTEDKDILAKIVMQWPMIVANEAPGMTVSQAIVEYEGSLSSEYFDELETKLRTQREISRRAEFPGLIAVERSRITGKPSSKRYSGKLMDEGSLAKSNRVSVAGNLMSKIIPENWSSDAKKTARFPYDISAITSTNDSGWIAVIHADGNNLGNVIRRISTNKAVNEIKSKDVLVDFSKGVSKATISAAQDAFKAVIPRPEVSDRSKYPIRPVIIGGDDITIICRADIALKFTKSFLELFRKYSKEYLSPIGKKCNLEILENGLSACAGVAFVKTHYPFHYAVTLATDLCNKAKKSAKEHNLLLTPSCLLFHKVQSSFVDDYSAITERELQVNGESIRFDCGPYYLKNEVPDQNVLDLDNLFEKVELLRELDSPSSGLRKWLSSLYTSKEHADQVMERLKFITQKDKYKCILEGAEISKNGVIFSPVFDWLTVVSIMKGGRN